MRHAIMTCHECKSGYRQRAAVEERLDVLMRRLDAMVECQNIAEKLADAPRLRALVARLAPGGEQAEADVRDALQLIADIEDVTGDMDGLAARLRAYLGDEVTP